MSLSRLFHRRSKGSQARSTQDQPITQSQCSVQSACHLLQLPTEVLYQVQEYIDVTDILILARTCRHLRQLLIYQHRRDDINKDLTEAKWDTYTRRLKEADCRKFLEQQSLGKIPFGVSICGCCLAPHPDHWFSSRELFRNPFERICLGRITPVIVCEHETIYFHDLVEMRKTKIKRRMLCTRHGHDSGVVLIDLERNDRSYDKETCTAVARLRPSNVSIAPFALTYLFMSPGFGTQRSERSDGKEWPICPHVNLRQVVQQMTPCPPWPKNYLGCNSCFSEFRRSDEEDATASLYVRRGLGYGGSIPDALWLAAVGIQPRYETSSKKDKQPFHVCRRR